MQGCHKAWVGGRNYDLSSNFITVKSIRMNLKNCFPKWKYFCVQISLSATLTVKFLNCQIIKAFCLRNT